MVDPSGARPPGETAGGGLSDIKANTGDIRLVMLTIGDLGRQIERLATDRKDDKDEVIRRIDESKTDLLKKVDETKVDLRERIDGVRQDHKDFIKDDFRPLRDDVAKLRLKWAWMAGVGAVIGALVGLFIELLKAHIH